MNITEVRIRLPDRTQHRSRMLATASVTFDDSLCIRDVRLIDQGREGVPPLLVMPNRKSYDHCAVCGCKIDWDYRYCPKCGRAIVRSVEEARNRLYTDIAFPTNQETRSAITAAVMQAFEEERANAESGVQG